MSRFAGRAFYIGSPYRHPSRLCVDLSGVSSITDSSLAIAFTARDLPTYRRTGPLRALG